MYIRKNHLTINEEQEIYEMVQDERVVWFGTADQLSELLGDDDWECDNEITE